MLSARQQHCLQGMGVRLWRGRDARPEVAADPPAAPVEPGTDPVSIPETGHAIDSLEATTPVVHQPTGAVSGSSGASVTVALDDWTAVDAAIQACQACALAAGCTQKVPGVGSRDAGLMIVGEGPGHDEDIRGEPFVGRSGQLLDRMLAAIGLQREQVFITNIVKCRPPNNRDPRVEEAASCRAFLDAQIRLVAPKVLLSVGRISAHNLLDRSDAVGKLIKGLHRLPGTELPLKVTYHPAYLLRNPPAKAIAWDDLKQVHRLLR